MKQAEEHRTNLEGRWNGSQRGNRNTGCRKTTWENRAMWRSSDGESGWGANQRCPVTVHNQCQLIRNIGSADVISSTTHIGEWEQFGLVEKRGISINNRIQLTLRIEMHDFIDLWASQCSFWIGTRIVPEDHHATTIRFASRRERELLTSFQWKHLEKVLDQRKNRSASCCSIGLMKKRSSDSMLTVANSRDARQAILWSAYLSSDVRNLPVSDVKRRRL